MTKEDCQLPVIIKATLDLLSEPTTPYQKNLHWFFVKLFTFSEISYIIYNNIYFFRRILYVW